MASTITVAKHLSVDNRLVGSLAIKAQESFKSESAKQTAAKKLAEALNDPAVLKEISESVERLGTDLATIKSGFESVNGKLLRFDAEGFLDTRRNKLRLGPEWQGLFDASLQQLSGCISGNSQQ
jgi:hypothetical protein